MIRNLTKPILLSGSLSLDQITHYPGSFKDLLASQKPDNISLSFLVEDIAKTEGGTGANIAYTLALLGITSTLLTSSGKDARKYLKRLTQIGVDTSHVIVSKTLNTAGFVGSTDNHSGQIGWFSVGAMVESSKISLKPWANTQAIVVCSAHQPETMRRHIQEAKEFGLTLIYDVGQQVNNLNSNDLRHGVSSAQILMVNDSELRVLAGKLAMSEDELENSVPTCVVTLGEYGSRISSKSLKHSVTIPVVPDIKVVDVTGAGDSYRSGFLFGLVNNLDLITCGKLGAVAASFAIEHAGTQVHNFTIEEFNNRYLQTFKELYVIK